MVFSYTIRIAKVNGTVVLKCTHEAISGSYFPAKVTIGGSSSRTSMAAVEARLNNGHDFIRDEHNGHVNVLPLLFIMIICWIQIQITSLSQSFVEQHPDLDSRQLD